VTKRVRGRAGQVFGDVEEGYGAVADTFRRQFAEGRETGAACAVLRDGRMVVDLWGGYRDGPRRLPWVRDTLVPVWSTTKGLASMTLAVAHSRGSLDFDEPVATYWREFAQNGKEEITVRQLLSHQAGLAALDEPISTETLADPDRLAAQLARQTPLWEPGHRQGYHAWTLGFYEGELLRRVDPAGRSIGVAFAEDVAARLGIEFYIGLPDHIGDERLATFHGLHPARGLLHLGAAPRGMLLSLFNPRSLTSRALMALPLARHVDDINDRAVLRHELAAVGGVGNARAIATAYGELATGGTTLRLVPTTLAELEAPAPVPPGGRRDLVLRSELPFSLGFGKPFPGFPMGSSDRSYAMAGTGGSIGMADPDLGLGYAYTPNLMGFGSPTDPREIALRAALYRAVGGRPQRPARNPRHSPRSWALATARSTRWGDLHPRPPEPQSPLDAEIERKRAN
jgi:CubicO group peptidase (beta-lactamase class C family)